MEISVKNQISVPDLIWEAAYTYGSFFAIIFISLSLFYFYGKITLSLLNLKLESTYISISAGVSVFLTLSYYLHKLSIPLSGVFAVLLLPLAIITGYSFYSLYQRKTLPRFIVSYSINIICDWKILVFSVLFLSQFLVAYGLKNPPIGSIGNNDIFSWALMADSFLGNANLQNIIPDGPRYSKLLEVNCLGTDFLLAFFAKISNSSSLEATPFYAVFCLTLITGLIFEILKQGFNLTNRWALIAAGFTGSNSFLYYIVHNGFYSQLVATIFYLSLILLTLVSLTNCYNKSLCKTIALFSILFCGILFCYQSGFVVFLIFSLLFSLLYSTIRFIFSIGKNKKYQAILYTDYMPFLSMVLGVIFSFALLPEFAYFTIEQSKFASSVVAGWPLPIVNPAYLLSIPFITIFPQKTGTWSEWIVVIMLLLATFVVLVSVNRKYPKFNLLKSLSLFLFFIISVSLYLIYFKTKGESYQAWKLASFVVLPISFSLIASILLLIQILFANKPKLALAIYFIFLCAMLASFISSPKKNSAFIGLNIETIHNIQALRRNLRNDGIKNLVLATPEFGNTMILFPLLSKYFKLYPLSVSYIFPFKSSEISTLDKTNTKIIEPHLKASQPPQDANKYAVRDIEESKLNAYTFKKAHANFLTIPTINGMSDPEPWGTWSVGNNVMIEIELPPDLKQKDFSIFLALTSFGQKEFAININNKKYGDYVIEKEKNIVLEINKNDSSSGKILLSFYIKNPQAPKDVNPGSNDPRLIGLGFISLELRDQKSNPNVYSFKKGQANYLTIPSVTGMSYSEPWGTWSIGNNVSMEFELPPSLKEKDFSLFLTLASFGQKDFNININNTKYGDYVIYKEEKIELKISKTESADGKIQLSFYIKNPQAPKDVNPGSDDPRLIGLGFISLELRDQSNLQ
jgi:hypothetical protein